MSSPHIQSIRWVKGGTLEILDQKKLPSEKTYLSCRSGEDVFKAIKELSVRGAPLIGIAGAYGFCLEMQRRGLSHLEEFKKAALEVSNYLYSSRPTAVNLGWALDRLRKVWEPYEGSVSDLQSTLLKEAKSIHSEDKDMCHMMGQYGVSLFDDGDKVLTICNTGALATGGNGTAFSVIWEAYKKKKDLYVYACETRPLLQGARLTAFELKEAGIPFSLICDSMAAMLMRQGEVTKVVVGADRIAANGDTANKIGTFSLAVLASHFDIPFYVAAPSSTFDLETEEGAQIPIEERPSEEVTTFQGRPSAPEEIKVFNPAFDVTDSRYIRGFITEKGLVLPPYKGQLSHLFA